MPFAKHSRRLTLLVLAAYLAVNSLGMLWHEHVHSHAGGEACCHAHLHGSQEHADHGHEHSQFAGGQTLPSGEQSGPRLVATQADHDCVVCRVTGQPVVTAVAVTVEVSADVTPDALPCPAAAPRLLAARLAQSRAPPAATL